MWRLIFFIPLLALTVYIFIKSQDPENDEDFDKQEELADIAIRMLKQGKDYDDADKIEFTFSEYDFSDEEKPYARFTLYTDRKTIPFKSSDGKLIRYKEIN